MKKVKFLILFCVMGFRCFAQNDSGDKAVHVVPKPAFVKVEHGHFQLNHFTSIVAANTQIEDVADMMAVLLDRPTGYHLRVVKGHKEDRTNSIILKLNKTDLAKTGNAGYTLQVNPQHVVVTANDPRGIFYGMQTLMQLLPPDIESVQPIRTGKWEIPCVHILDYPRFEWRGLMLDVSRHFFTVKEVEAYINEMAKYKFNIFHWHLTDDQGWRIQIKGLPKLTEVGAWRVTRTGHWGFAPPQAGEKATYGGYYTQKDIREVVAYAQKRFVTIVPEIDVPAHSLALIASYPNLSCTKLQYHVNPGSAFNGDNVLCVANDSTWLILDKIFTQVAELFPGRYIHVGGDEANKGFWAEDPKDKKLMKDLGINTSDSLQSYFEKRLEKLIVSKGKEMIGWGEILEGGIAPEATVMSWQGMEEGIKAAKMGHQVVMTPGRYCYLDHYQGDPLVEPAFVASVTTRLSTCYKFEPVPPGIDPKYILGGQGNLWSEFVPNFRHAEYMTWPRAMALSEVFWSPKDKRDWNDFLIREQYRFKYMDVAQVKYARSQYDAIITGVKDPNDSLKVRLSTEMLGLDIYYRFDGTNPDKFSPKYEGVPLSIPKGATEIRLITYRDGKPIGHQINCPLSLVAKRIEE